MMRSGSLVWFHLSQAVSLWRMLQESSCPVHHSAHPLIEMQSDIFERSYEECLLTGWSSLYLLRISHLLLPISHDKDA